MSTYFAGHALFAVIAVWLVLGSLAWLQNRTARIWALPAVAMLLALGGGLKVTGAALVGAVKQPPKWDLGIFWMWGRVALTSHKVYDPASNASVGLSVAHDVTWRQQVLAWGFIYPPPSILLFAPLGLFETFQRAAPWWYAVNVLALVLAIVTAWYNYFRPQPLGLLATAALVLAFPATSQALRGQPIAIALLFMLLYTADRPKLRAGVWLGLAFIVKPLAIVLFLEPLIKRRFGQLFIAIGTVASAAAGAVLLLGWKNVVPYFTNGPYRRYPPSMWTDPQNGNESLYSAIVRLLHEAVPHPFMQEPLFLLVAALMTAATVILCMRLAQDDDGIMVSLLITLALLLYPPSALYYNDLLLIPLFTLWRNFSATRPIAVIACISAIYGFTVYSTAFNIVAPLSLWAVFAALAAARIPRVISLRSAGA